MAAGAALPSRWRKPKRGKCHQFLWPESCPVGSHERGAVRRGPSRNRTEPSEVRRQFRPSYRRSYPGGTSCYCADQGVVRSGRHDPVGRPVARQDRKTDRGDGDAGGRGKPRPAPETEGARPNRAAPAATQGNLRAKRPDPSRQANVRTPSGAVLAAPATTRMYRRRVLAPSAAPLPAGRGRAGAEASLAHPGRRRPGRSRHETATSASRGEWRREARGPRKRERQMRATG